MDRGVNFFGGIASLFSIAIATVALFFKGDTKDNIQAALSLIAVIGFYLAYWRYSKYGLHRTSRIAKATLVQVARTHIVSAQKKVVLFSNDLSWVNDYADAISDRVKHGLEVLVIHKQSNQSQVLTNSEHLKKLGATVVELTEDHGIRATLIDPDDPDTALLFVASKRRQTGSAAPVQPGESGTDKDFSYECAIYQTGADKMVVKAIARLASNGFPSRVVVSVKDVVSG